MGTRSSKNDDDNNIVDTWVYWNPTDPENLTISGRFKIKRKSNTYTYLEISLDKNSNSILKQYINSKKKKIKGEIKIIGYIDNRILIHGKHGIFDQSLIKNSKSIDLNCKCKFSKITKNGLGYSCFANIVSCKKYTSYASDLSIVSLSSTSLTSMSKHSNKISTISEEEEYENKI